MGAQALVLTMLQRPYACTTSRQAGFDQREKSPSHERCDVQDSIRLGLLLTDALLSTDVSLIRASVSPPDKRPRTEAAEAPSGLPSASDIRCASITAVLFHQPA